MMIYKDEKYGFYELFNEENGTLIRGDIRGVDPFARSFPELLDVGIMGHCSSGLYCQSAGVDCYQCGSDINAPHMSVEDFELIARQACGKTFQIALGGAGDPNKHPNFEEILKICRYYRIVPNLTTSGFQLTEDEVTIIKEHCGAVAVSWYSRLNKGQESNGGTIDAINRLVAGGCTTNIHFVVSNDTLDEVIYRLDFDQFADGINAVVFILYKPVGLGVSEKVIRSTDQRLTRFFELVSKKHPFQIGFDTCFTPAILRFGKEVSVSSIESCEAATFSMYIDSELNCYPCSFGVWNSKMSESLHKKSLREIWDGEQFLKFRRVQKEKCISCSSVDVCRFGCKIGLDIDLC